MGGPKQSSPTACGRTLPGMRDLGNPDYREMVNNQAEN